MTRTRRSTAPALAAVLALATLAGCGQAGTDGSDDTGSPVETEPDTESATAAAPTPTDDGATQSMDRPQPLPAPSEPIGVLPTGPVPDAVLERDDVRAAIAAEATRSGVARTAVSVAGYAAVTWNDGSLGCPEPGQMYTQALVPGHQLVLEVDGELHSYHAADGGEFSYCAHPMVPSGGASSDS